MTLEVIQFRKAGEKWKPVRLGFAKKNDKGQLNVYLDALPLPDEKGCSFVIQPRREREDRPQYGDVASGDRNPDAGYYDDSGIPF